MELFRQRLSYLRDYLIIQIEAYKLKNQVIRFIFDFHVNQLHMKSYYQKMSGDQLKRTQNGNQKFN